MRKSQGGRRSSAASRRSSTAVTTHAEEDEEKRPTSRSSADAAPSSTSSSSSTTSSTPATRQFDREVAFFGFHPVKYIDEIINAVNQYACDAADSLEESLRAALARKEAAANKSKSSASSSSSSSSAREGGVSEDLSKGIDRVLKILQQAIDKNYDLWELYVLKNTFVVPAEFTASGLLKSEEEEQERVAKEQAQQLEVLNMESANLDQDIEHLKRRILATTYINAALEKENEALDNENSRLTEHVQLLERLSAKVEGGGLDQVQSIIERLISRREQLMVLINELQELEVPIKRDQDPEARHRELTSKTKVESIEGS